MGEFFWHCYTHIRTESVQFPTSGICKASTASRCSWAQSQAITCREFAQLVPLENSDDVSMQNHANRMSNYASEINFSQFDFEIWYIATYTTKLSNCHLMDLLDPNDLGEYDKHDRNGSTSPKTLVTLLSSNMAWKSHVNGGFNGKNHL